MTTIAEILGLLGVSACLFEAMRTKLTAMASFKQQVNALCKAYEQERAQRSVDHERVLQDFRSKLHTAQEDVITEVLRVRTKHNLPAPTRDWTVEGSASPQRQLTDTTIAEVDMICLALDPHSPKVRTTFLPKFQAALDQRFRDEAVQLDTPPEEVGAELDRLKAREEELVHQIHDYYHTVLEADEQKFDELLQFYEEAIVAQAEQITAPLLQALQA